MKNETNVRFELVHCICENLATKVRKRMRKQREYWGKILNNWPLHRPKQVLYSMIVLVNKKYNSVKNITNSENLLLEYKKKFKGHRKFNILVLIRPQAHPCLV